MRAHVFGLVGVVALLGGCPDNELKVVHDPPVVSIVEPADGSTFFRGENVAFRAIVQTSSSDDSLTDITHQWIVNSGTICDAQPVNADGSALCDIVFEDEGENVVQVIATDPRLDTATAQITVNVIENTPPTITLTSPDDESAYQPGDLVVFAATVADAEDGADELVVTVTSSVQGDLGFTATPASSGDWTDGTTLDSGTHLITARVTDTAGQSAQASLRLYVNGKPGPPTVSITPDPAPSGEDLRAVVDVPSVDPEDDAITYSYDWYNDGTLYSSSNNPKVPLGITVRDEFWEVYVYPYDGFSYGNPGYAAITIDNSPPRIDSAAIDPTPADTTDDLEAVAVAWFDQDSDPERYRYKWFHNGSEDLSETTITFPYEKTTRGDTVQVQITPYDNYESGDPVSSGVITIANSKPTAPIVQITPGAPEPENNLTCAIITPSTDADGDFITYSYAWYRNGSLTTFTGNVVTAGDTYEGDTWECVVTPNDGVENGPYGSDSVGINDTIAPDAPVIDTPYPYRNEDEWTLTGLCESSCDLIFYCSDSSSSWTDTDTCDVGGTFEHDMALVRGEISDCYVTCTDASGNVSPNSNTVSTEVCDPYDQYEDSLGYGDTAGEAIDEWAAVPDDGSSIVIQANVIGPDIGTGDWYLLSGSDNVVADRSAGQDDYDFDIELTAGAGAYSFIVYKGGTAMSDAECGTSGGYTEYNDYVDDSTHSKGNQCRTGTPAGYNTCEDMSNDYWVHVFRNGSVSESCQHYELTIQNGI